MKKIILIGVVILQVIIFSLSGCKGHDGGSTPSSAPAISNLYFYPQSVTQYTGGGATTVDGSFDFIDQDGDVQTVTLVDSIGNTLSFPANAPGIKVGILYWTITGVNTTTIGNYPFTIYVTDSAGLQSNKLTDIFSVTAL